MIEIARFLSRRVHRSSCSTVLLVFTVALSHLSSAAQSHSYPVRLPARFEGDRIYAEPVMRNGEKIRLFTDTGGGLFIYKAAADRLHLNTINLGKEGDDAFLVASLPEFRDGFAIPGPLTRGGRIPVFAPTSDTLAATSFILDGMLGQEWFAGRVWTFDYRRRQLFLLPAGSSSYQIGGHRVELGFLSSESGERVLNFPRIQVIIAGEPLDLLLDTGATTSLTVKALSVLHDLKRPERAVCFITASRFEKWRKEHPHWRVIDEAERKTDEPMIRVPKLQIAGYSVGPIWFMRRPDKNFREFMARFMDKSVDGALGGNALRYFRMTIDYPNAVAIFKK